MWGEAGDEEVPEPVVGGGEGLGQGTVVVVEHLAVVDPWGWVPGWGVEGSPEVEEEDGGGAGWSEIGGDVLGWLGDGDVGTDVVEAETTSEGTNHQKTTTAKSLNKEEEVDEGEGSLDNAKETGSEEGGVRSSDTDGLEDGWRVVVDGVDTGGVLPEEERATEEESVHDLSVAAKSLEWLPETETDSVALGLNGSINGVDLLLHVDLVDAKLADPAEVAEGLLALALEHKPSWRLADPDGSDEEETSWDQLNSEGNEPLSVGWGQVLGESVLS